MTMNTNFLISMMKKNKQNIKKIFIILICSAVIGCVFSSVVAVFDYLRTGNNKGLAVLDVSQVKAEGNVQQEGEEYYISSKGGKIVIEFTEDTYINKLQYNYSVAEPLLNDAEIAVSYRNIYGDENTKVISDNYFVFASRSVVNIRENVSKIEILIPEENAELKVGNFAIDNGFKWNPLIALVVSGVVFEILYLICFRKKNAKHPGVSTCISVLVLGMCLLVLQPPFVSGWDEQIHITRSYDLAVTGDEQGTPNVISYLTTNSAWFYLHPDISFEERVDYIRVMNQMGDSYGESMDGYGLQMNTIGYIFQAAGITIGKFLNLPFYLVWTLGKFANLALYAIGMGIAVAIVPFGKRLLMVVAHFPIMIFLSTVYTYDVTVNVFITLAICIWLRELVNKNQVFEYKWRIAFVVCLVIGCMPKAVYAPLILCALLLPSSKFKSKKDAYISKGLLILVFLMLMSTFVMPTVSSPSSGGDSRGGDTSVATQMSYVLGQPFAYAVVLLKNIFDTAVNYTFGTLMSDFAYWGAASQPVLFSILLAGTLMMDSYAEEGKRIALNIKEKIVAFFAIAFTVALIWTALYLSFTEVGETTIAGVQARYYLPFIFLFYLLFKPKKIKSEFKVENYQMTVMLIASGLFVWQLIQNFLLPGAI